MSIPFDKDSIKRFLFKNSDIRGEILTLNNSFRDACDAQNLDPALRSVFGQFVAGTCLIGEMLKFEGLLTLQARGDGYIKLLMAESNNRGDFRGVAQVDSEAHSPITDTSTMPEMLGEGVLAITLDPAVGNRYQGIVPLDGSTLAECLGHYFEQSEQIPTFFLLFADETRCGGILLQCLPAQEIRDPEEREALWQTAIQLASTMKSDEFFETDHDTLLYRLFHELNCETFEAKPLQFKCSCSRERSAKAIISLGKSEIDSMIRDAKPIELNCHLCGTDYVFSIEDIEALAKQAMTIH